MPTGYWPSLSTRAPMFIKTKAHARQLDQIWQSCEWNCLMSSPSSACLSPFAPARGGVLANQIKNVDWHTCQSTWGQTWGLYDGHGWAVSYVSGGTCTGENASSLIDPPTCCDQVLPMRAFAGCAASHRKKHAIHPEILSIHREFKLVERFLS